SLSLSAACCSASARACASYPAWAKGCAGLIGPPVGVLSRLDSLTTASDFGARLFYIRRSPAALKRHAGRELTLPAGALLVLPLQKFAKPRLALLLGKICGRRTFILQKRGKIAASHLWIHRILWANPT